MNYSAIRLVKAWEGCVLTAYPDPATGGDPWTIGWGSTGQEIRKGLVWTQAQADDALMKRVDQLADRIQAETRVPLSENQLGALVSFAYNVGISALLGSTLFAYVRKSDFAAAAKQFDVWNHAAGKVMPGLTRRRSAERAVFEGTS